MERAGGSQLQEHSGYWKADGPEVADLADSRELNAMPAAEGTQKCIWSANPLLLHPWQTPGHWQGQLSLEMRATEKLKTRLIAGQLKKLLGPRFPKPPEAKQ